AQLRRQHFASPGRSGYLQPQRSPVAREPDLEVDERATFPLVRDETRDQLQRVDIEPEGKTVRQVASFAHQLGQEASREREMTGALLGRNRGRDTGEVGHRCAPFAIDAAS